VARNRKKDTALNVAAAIRERIRSLEEELAHWRGLLAKCELEAPDAGPSAPIKLDVEPARSLPHAN
jgi:hypothetical protein